MYQTWDKLLFMHWPVPVEQLRPLIPSRLNIDTFKGTAWISITPFTMRGIRPVLLPALPVVSSSHEINVRTYVHLEGVPGVWFFSLDASNPLAVLGARIGFHLPYFQARMSLRAEDDTIRFTSRRMHPGAPAAAFEAVWTNKEARPEAQPGTLAFFLVERYCLYAVRGGRLYRARIFHSPWPLCRTRLQSWSSTMVAAQGLSPPQEKPLLHSQAAALKVGIWPLRRI